MIKIHNTLTKKLEKFVPIEPGKVKMYVCGPTVYNYIHIGNARPAIFFDTVRRYFEYRDYKVTYVQNFTDVDDKMIEKANVEGVTVKDIADKYISAYLEDTKKVNLKEEGMIRPKATDHIKEMIKSIKILVNKGYAYESNGDIYFDVEKYKEKYGELSGQKIEDLKAGARVEVTDIKKSSVDFALWKSAKEGELSWESPWGKGRPGWHIECSAMSEKYLGASFDIHGGGQDLIFPHHENEIAQSKCSYGGDYARYWMHNGYINIKGEKMSKSKGNFFLLREILEEYEGKVVRFFMLSSHYRKPVDFSETELEMAKSAIKRIENSMLTMLEKFDTETSTEDQGSDGAELRAVLENSKIRFVEAMDEDFNTAQAIGVLFELIKEANKFMEGKVSNGGKEVLKDAFDFLKTTLVDVLGIELVVEKHIKDLTVELVELIKEVNIEKPFEFNKENITVELIEFLIEQRKIAKKDKNFALSDEIRDKMAEIGVKIKDGREKTTWTI
ncbi:cysteine--tRNA ligase [Psychrilyobacter sp.]|uniref:cysteine--tRNA ligase n=1 Tax=Psychrilyobacter sp. TaxID=2586924 RepID=UPI0030189405